MSLSHLLKIIGQNVASLRKAMYLNQNDAATRAGFSYRYYQKIEAGKANITLSSLYDIAKFLKVNPVDLLKDSDD